MTKLRTCGLSIFAPTQCRRWQSGELKLSKVACIVFVFCVAAVISSSAQTFTNLASFDAAPSNGSLVQGVDGNFYGTGGGGSGSGTVFEITPGGRLTTLHNFDGADGAGPSALIQATNGNFYGTTLAGGTSGFGTVFEITPEGNLTTLHSFDGTDVTFPDTGLVQASDGNFYGTAGGGSGFGTLFEITPEGKLTALHSFDETDGAGPSAALIQATNGNFYGTTFQGGPYFKCVGTTSCGTVFEITSGGKETALHSFGFTDGAYPFGGVLQAANGNFYGTTFQGGANQKGTVFEITAEGMFTTLLNFDITDGALPHAPLVQATDGSLYGTTLLGGVNNRGTVFEITPQGKLTTLHSFDFTYGASPNAGLVQATNGKFYGTTFIGGANDAGTVFSLDMGLGPFVKFIRDSGKLGETAQILGQGFTGTTGVSFNGTNAVFTVKSDTYLTAAVPDGATTGFVTVTMSSGSLKSNQIFRVEPQILSVSSSSGPAGTALVVTGESLTKTYAVTFGVPKASFTVNSDTQLTVTVPPGAQTGKFAVLTSGGTAYSPDCFVVTP